MRHDLFNKARYWTVNFPQRVITMDIAVDRKKTLFALAFLLAICSVAMGWVDSLLTNETVPFGIVSFEFAGALTNADAMFHSWGTAGKTAAAFSLGIDYLYLVLYVMFGYLCLTITGEKIASRHTSTGYLFTVFARLLPVAGFFDAIENYGLIRVLFGTMNEFWPQLAYGAALVKFVIVGVCVVALVLGQCFLMWQRQATKR